ncbi:MAG: TetR/AcrR family transcriptional regulator [Anaerolineales bacterium]|jgi:AcrR family transcriptional regulator|nr:TetR/AcrR family transcriptional regulator [Anaerolineales bacterium]
MTRDDILVAAAQVFRQKGFHGASMADIAEAVNLQKASLYHHVSSKQEILLALLNRALEMLTEGMDAVMAQDVPADEKLRLAMRSYLQVMTHNLDVTAVLLMEHRSLDETLTARHIPIRDHFEGLWRALISEGNQAGIFACADIPMTVRGLLGVLNWTVTWYRPNGSLSPEQIADHFSAIFLEGIRGGPG